jgi:hypothetical protein
VSSQPVITGHSRPKRKSIKPAAIQSAVIAKYAQGESKVQIAKDLEIQPNTVRSILDSSEIEQVILQGRSRVVSLIPRAIDTVEYRLNKHDGNIALGVLRGTQVLQTQQITQNVTNNFALLLGQLKQSKQADQAETAIIDLKDAPKVAPNQ